MTKWLPRHLPTSAELDGQRQAVFAVRPKVQYRGTAL